MTKVVLVGNPNAGKTTLYNALTGASGATGNWSGVTVEQQRGYLRNQQLAYQIIDLPGVYSLAISEKVAVDAKITYEVIQEQQFDVVINVINANNLERNLYLTLQLLEMRVPVIVVVTMLDKAKKQGFTIDLPTLAQSLGCPVLAMPAQSKKQSFLGAIRNTITKVMANQEIKSKQSHLLEFYVAPIPLAIMAIANAIALALRKPAACCQWLALRLLEGQTITKVLPTLAFDSHILHIVSHWQQQVMAVGGEDIDILLADSRYRLIQSICAKCVARTGGTNYVLKISQYIDRLVLNRFLGLPIFLAVMYGMFFVTIGIGGSLQNLLAKWGESYLITNLSQYFAQYHLSPLVMVIFVQGLGRGLMTTINFIPVLGALFFYMILLEESGYMARAAFVIDRLMRLLGLPGKAFVPMLIGFGCNVPAVLASRTLLQLRDRILTIMMSPFMSCGARLAIYALFTAAFFPKHGDLVVFALYCIGIIVAMLTGLLLRYTCLLGQPEPVLMELPAYQLPNIITAGRYASKRLVVFIVRAGKYIVPITMILGVLQSVSFAGVINDGSTDFPTILAVCGRALLPLFVPLGIGGDNWPAVIGLLSGVSAKEVIVGTLNTLYSQLASNHLAIGTVIAATVPTQVTQRLVYGTMYQYFVGPIGAFSYLLFVLLYFPCISTLVVMWRELNYRWALFSLFWSMLVAYGVAVIFYQLATFKQHMLMSFFWLSIIIVVMLLVVYLMRVVCVRDNQQNI